MGKVFISYSHDSPEHSERVLALSNRLRALGVEAELDRYHMRPPQGWPHWCEEQLRPEISSFVLAICTPTYRARVENRVGADEGRGAYWEGAILYNYLYNAKGNSRFIPVLLDEASESAIPLPLDGQTRYRIRAFELAEPGFRALYRELTSQPETPKPSLGDVVKLDSGGAPIAAKALPEKEAKWDVGSDGRPLDERAAREPGRSGAGAPETATARGSFWSPFSDEESVARGEVRFWAIVETFAAMAVFWWIAIRYETFLLLTTSLFVAPLLLLRSDESTRLGVKWIDEGLFPPSWPEGLFPLEDNPEHSFDDNEDSVDDNFQAQGDFARRWMSRWVRIGLVTGIAVGSCLGYPAAKHFLVAYEGWSAFGRSMGISFTCSFLAAAVVVTAMNAANGLGKRGMMFALTVVGPVGAGAGAAAGAGVIAGAVAGGEGPAVVPGTLAGTVAAVAGEMFLAPYSPSLYISILLCTFIVRFATTTCHAREGYYRLPTNVRRLAVYMAPLQQPELIPGLSVGNPLRFNVHWRMLFSELPKLFPAAIYIYQFAVNIVLSVLIYLPAWGYRFIIKSTMWFWWILFIVGGAPRLDGGIEGLRADAYRKASAWAGIATTVFAVVGFGLGWLLKPWAENLATGAKLPTAVALLVLVDWKSIPVVQWITLASALTTIAVIFWTRDVYVDWQNPQRRVRAEAQLPWLGYLVKWKTGFGAVGIALLMLYFALYANAVHHYVPVSNWTAGWLHLLYGAAAEPLRPA